MKALGYLQENPRIKARECNIACLGASVNLSVIPPPGKLKESNFHDIDFCLFITLSLCLSTAHTLLRITLNMYNGVPGYCRL